MNLAKNMGQAVLNAQHDPAANTNAVVTITKPSQKRMTIYITGITFSASAAPAAAVAATVTGTGTTKTIRIPAAAFAPIHLAYGTHPLRIAIDTDAVVTLPALGAGVLGSVSVDYFIGEA
jgi:hypothetical protein